jgi:putative photosynthetic complex assembly protein
VSDPFKGQPFPRAALFGMGGLILFTLVVVTVAQLTGYEDVGPAAADVVEQKLLRFVDAGSGEVRIYDAGNDQLVAILAPGTENFIRGVVRSLARERRAQDIGRNIPFQLALHSDNRLTLTDQATGRSIDLQAFGQTNVDAFARLLAHPTPQT